MNGRQRLLLEMEENGMRYLYAEGRVHYLFAEGRVRYLFAEGRVRHGAFFRWLFTNIWIYYIYFQYKLYTFTL
jgi:hypothetical protein